MDISCLATSSGTPINGVSRYSTDRWLSDSPASWILTVLFWPASALGRCCPLGVYLPEQRAVSASLSWALAKKVILSTRLYWHGNGCCCDAVFLRCYLSLDNRSTAMQVEGSEVCKISNQAIANADETGPKRTPRKGVLMWCWIRCGSSGILFNYLKAYYNGI